MTWNLNLNIKEYQTLRFTQHSPHAARQPFKFLICIRAIPQKGGGGGGGRQLKFGSLLQNWGEGSVYVFQFRGAA